jgi:hypothetical protein
LEMHLVAAALVVLHAVLLFRRIWKLGGADSTLSRGAVWLGVALVAQLALGFGTYLGKFHPGTIGYAILELLTTGHVVVGGLLLASALSVTLWSYRLLAPGEKQGDANAVAEQVRA